MPLQNPSDSNDTDDTEWSFSSRSEDREIELESLPDKTDDPTMVTVFSSHEGEISTHWLTIGIDHVYDLSKCR